MERGGWARRWSPGLGADSSRGAPTRVAVSPRQSCQRVLAISWPWRSLDWFGEPKNMGVLLIQVLIDSCDRTPVKLSAQGQKWRFKRGDSVCCHVVRVLGF
jgi:hypothetical protein